MTRIVSNQCQQNLIKGETINYKLLTGEPISKIVVLQMDKGLEKTPVDIDGLTRLPYLSSIDQSEQANEEPHCQFVVQFYLPKHFSINID